MLVVPGHMRIPADGMADQDSVVARGIQLAVGLVSNRDTGKLAAEFQGQWLVERDGPRVPQWLGTPHAVTAIKWVLTHGGYTGLDPMDLQSGSGPGHCNLLPIWAENAVELKEPGNRRSLVRADQWNDLPSVLPIDSEVAIERKHGSVSVEFGHAHQTGVG